MGALDALLADRRSKRFDERGNGHRRGTARRVLPKRHIPASLKAGSHKRPSLNPELEYVGAAGELYGLNDCAVFRAIDRTGTFIADRDILPIPLDSAGAYDGGGQVWVHDPERAAVSRELHEDELPVSIVAVRPQIAGFIVSTKVRGVDRRVLVHFCSTVRFPEHPKGPGEVRREVRDGEISRHWIDGAAIRSFRDLQLSDRTRAAVGEHLNPAGFVHNENVTGLAGTQTRDRPETGQVSNQFTFWIRINVDQVRS